MGMSKMNKLKKLISQFCPHGVEYWSLEDCCQILDNKRKPITKALREAGEYPYYGANGIQDYVSEYIFDGVFVLVGEDGSVITPSGSPVVTWAEGKIWVNNHAHVVKEKDGVLLRYLYHYLQTVDVSTLIHGNIPKLTGGDFRAIKIPVPPVEIQREIVQILDNFTELSAELSAELNARKKQYEYYRDKLLTFSDSNDSNTNVKLYKIGELSTSVSSGKSQEKLLQGLYPVYGSTGIIAMTNTYQYSDEKILIARVGANAGYVHIASGKYDVSDNTLIINLKDNINLKYIYYMLVNLNLNRFAKGGGQPLVTAGQIKEIEIPVPLDAEQERIVSILDRFDALCNDISAGIPAEIEARQKQYEYYRDKLLTFKELV